ncbi:MAG: sugar-binding protein [Anaerolineae bacterium]
MSRIWWILFPLALVLSACGPQAAPPAATATSLPPTATLPSSETPTPAPTATFTPMPPAEARRPEENGPTMLAQRLSQPLTLDGDLKDWPDFPCRTLDQDKQIGYGDLSTWGGPSDLSGSFCWGWDDEALYLAVDVKDDRVQAHAKGNFWENDYVELWLDTNLAKDFYETQNNGDDFQFGFMPGNFSDVPSRATVFVPGVSTSKMRQLVAQFQRTPQGYRGEIKIPWATFGDNLDRSGNRLGASLCFSDNDADQPAQEMMICTAPAALSQWGNPMLWNNLELLAPQTSLPSSQGNVPVSAQASSDFLRVYFTHFSPDDHLMLYIDCRPNYGEDSVPGVFADYLVQDGGLHYWSAEKGSKGWKWLGLVPFSNKNGQSEWDVPTRWLSLCTQSMKVVLQRLDKKWNQHYVSPVLNVENNLVSHAEPPFISITFNHHAPAGHLFVYIDSDNRENTGNTTIFPGRGIDYILQDDSLYQWINTTWKWLAAVRTEKTATHSTWSFSSQYIQAPLINAKKPIKLGFSRQDSSWNNLFTSPILWIDSYNIVYTEPGPTPTPTPAPTYTFTFNNNYASGDHIFMYLDTDNNSGTGYSIGGIGADYMLQDGGLYHSTGGPGWGWTSVSCALSFTSGANAVWNVPSPCLGTPAFGYKVIFQRQNSAWTAVYTSSAVTVSGYSVSHSEPAPTPTPTMTPTPTPIPAYSFTFNNNYFSGDRLRLYLNTDNNLSTGDWIGGADYMAEWLPSGPFLAMYQWTGSWNTISCSSLSASGTSTATWSFYASCIGSPSFPFTANFVRMDSGWNIVYNGGPVTVNAYSVSHTEP